MMERIKIKMMVELDCESWMENDIEPKTNEEWAVFFMKYLVPYPTTIIGEETEKGQEIVVLRGFGINVLDVSEPTKNVKL